MAKHLKKSLSLLLCVALVFSMFTMCFTASAATGITTSNGTTTYAWDFTGDSGAAFAEEMLANGTHVMGSNQSDLGVKDSLDAFYDAESAAFELDAEYEYVKVANGQTGAFLGQTNGVIFNTPDGTTPSTLNIVTGTDDVCDTGNHIKYNAGVIIGQDANNIYTIRSLVNAGFFYVSFGYTPIASSGASLEIDSGDGYVLYGKSSSGSKDNLTNIAATYKNGELVDSTTTGYTNLIKTYTDLPSTADLKNSAVLKNIKIEYDVKVVDNVVTVDSSAVLPTTSEGNNYKIVFKTCSVYVEDGALKFSYNNGSSVVDCETISSTVDASSYKTVFGFARLNNNTTPGTDVNAQVYSVKATYTGGSEGGDTTCKHNYSSVVTEPTCVAEGYTTYTCSACGDSYTDNVVAARGHDLKTTTVDATCTTAGSTTQSCSRCDYTNTTAIPAKGHSFSDPEVTKPATCTEAGEQTGTCTACGETTSAVIDALGHDLSTVTAPSTCTATGATTTTCSRCDYEDKVDLPLADHSYGDWVVDKEATEEEAGSKYKTCSVCGDTVTEEIPVIGANPSYTWDFTEGDCSADFESKVTKFAAKTNANLDVSSIKMGYNSDVKAYEIIYPNTSFADVAGMLFNDVGTPETLQMVTGYNATATGTTASNVYAPGVIYATDENGIYYFVPWMDRNLSGKYCRYSLYYFPCTFEADGSIKMVGAGTSYSAQFVKNTVVNVAKVIVTDNATGDVVTNEDVNKTFANIVNDTEKGLVMIPDEAMDLGKVYNHYSVVTDSNGTSTIKVTFEYSDDEYTYNYVLGDFVFTSTGYSFDGASETAYSGKWSDYTHNAYTAKYGVAAYSYDKNFNNATQIYSVSVNAGEGGEEQPHEHSYNKVVTEPTCETEGYTTYTCSTCGDSYVDDKVAALGHNYETTTVDATCETAGSTTTTCSRCDYEDVEIIAVLGHDYKTTTVDATCEAAGSITTTCSRCDYNNVEVISATGHSYKAAAVTPPTATSQGYTTYTCSACGDSYKDDYVDALEINAKMNVILAGKVGIKITATPNFAVDSMTITVGDVEDSMVKEGEAFTYTIEKFSYEMADKFNITLTAGEVTKTRENVSVASLLETYSDNEDDAVKNLAIATANYGAAAQVYFGINTDTPANKWVPEESKTPAKTWSDVSGCDINAVREDGYEDAKLSATVQLGSEIKILVLVGHDTFAGEAPVIMCGDVELDVVKNTDGRYYALTDGILPNQMDDILEFTVTAGGNKVATFNYSVNTYIANKGKTAEGSMLDLLNAMATYGITASDYLAK